MSFESQFIKEYPCILVGTDEAGRGPLAGPVVAGAVAFQVESAQHLNQITNELRKQGIQDSKKLSELKRKELRALDWESRFSLSWVQIQAEDIDQINILQASLKAMKIAAENAVSTQKNLPVIWLIDGHRAPKDVNPHWQVHPVISGDALSSLIGLASVIAKVERDEIMRSFHEKYPEYGFNQHSGYPTAMHRQAIASFGPSPIHRKTFKGVKEYLSR